MLKKVKGVLVGVARAVKRYSYAFVAAGAGLITGMANAGGPPTMDAVEFPIDLASVGLALFGAAAAVLIVVFGSTAGITLTKKLFRWIKGAI